MSTVGIVSPGAMGSAVAQVLAAGGARVVATLEHRSSRTAELAEGIELLPSLDAVVEASQIILSIVPPGAVLEVADAVAEAATRTGAQPTVADLNAIAPATMEAVAARLTSAGLSAGRRLDLGAAAAPSRNDDHLSLGRAGRRRWRAWSHRDSSSASSASGSGWPRRSRCRRDRSTRARPRSSPRRSGRPARTECSSPCSPTFVATTPTSSTMPRACCRASPPSRAATSPRCDEIAATQEHAGLTPDLFSAFRHRLPAAQRDGGRAAGTRAGRSAGCARGRARVDRRPDRRLTRSSA